MTRRYPCPECDAVFSIATPEQKGAIHLDCPCCLQGRVFRDSRGGFECTACSQRFLIHQDVSGVYGGPDHVGGPLRWWERPAPWWGVCALMAAAAGLLWVLPPWSWVLLFLAKCSWDEVRKKR